MSNLNGAYKDALQNLSQSHGANVAMVVQAVLESQNELTEFEYMVRPMNITNEARQKLIDTMTEQITNDMAIMCILIGKKFKADILPLVEQITKKATGLGRHLQ